MTDSDKPNPQLEDEEIPSLVDPSLINQSAQEFADSITSGDLYKELKGEGKKD